MKGTGSIVLSILLCFSCFPFVSDGGGQCYDDSTSTEASSDKTRRDPTWPTLISKAKNNLNPTEVKLSENDKGEASYPSTEEMISNLITCIFLLVIIVTGCILRSQLQNSHLLWPRGGSGSGGEQSGFSQRINAEDLSDGTIDINNNNHNNTDNYVVHIAM